MYTRLIANDGRAIYRIVHKTKRVALKTRHLTCICPLCGVTIPSQKDAYKVGTPLL